MVLDLREVDIFGIVEDQCSLITNLIHSKFGKKWRFMEVYPDEAEILVGGLILKSEVSEEEVRNFVKEYSLSYKRIDNNMDSYYWFIYRKIYY